LNRQIATYCNIDLWLVKPHDKLKTRENHPDVDTIHCPTGSPVHIDQFIKGVDTVVFCEMPYYSTLIDVCKAKGKRTVCVPMMEWMPAGGKGWPQQVDLFLCPTQQCYDVFKNTVPCTYFPWPVDTQRFKFQPRTVCNQFLFCNGNGGWKGRKGGSVIREALAIWPEMPLLIRSQLKEDWPTGVEVLPEVAENYELYERGDVLVSPHSVDGLGLEGMEAMACGMPVISTDGLPWDEIPALDRIDSLSEKRSVRRPVDWYLPKAADLVHWCKYRLGKPIDEASTEAHDWAMSMSWDKLKDQFQELVLNGARS